ncbi:MAG: response regulator [Bdellovibrionota bacterium]
MSSSQGQTLLIVDDDEIFRSRIAGAFRARQFEVQEANGVATALIAAKSFDPELALVDLRMPDASGLELIGGLRELCSGIRIVVLTGYGSIATAVEALHLGAAHYLTKPTDVDSILRAFFPAETKERPETLLSKPPSLEQVEWEHINRVLLDHSGNISQAAKALGIHRRSLQRKLGSGEPLK